ncbi:type VII secretion-associated serine protease mycosin [Actinoplanes friuliensis]|uniref:Peptidase S8/S53 subtilisin kexin sedolisin n=1 Tax=Actinoplanes friuliensis DSM 7358 TaxID=1246995 RepID=U5WEZ1_9ACTN|nr:type VII secretion-associated serine protease mycosin [Actinoplanes friuliensis]AGZ46570.1 peptidase S8/S53 subtilisin kexin sedolisin [Actinoplanes friuliensis DSM 7358]
MNVRSLPVRLAATTAAAGLCVGLSGTPVLAETGGQPPQAVPLASPFASPLASPEPWVGDSVRAEQWHLKTLNVAGAWTYSMGAGVTVAVIDSGVDSDHKDLQGQVLPGLDLVDPDGDGDTDLVGHGTTVSAIIAGRSDDDAGVVGIAPKAKILPVRVLDRENRYDDAMIVAKGVRWAVDHGARVINLSLGGNGSSPALAAALDYAFAKDVVVVACTGNASTSSSSGVWYPAREPGILAVAGMEKDGDILWSGSITGKETVVTAPATQLVGARPDGYWRVQGTSFAAPMVSGTAALIRSRWPTMSAGEVINRIIKTAKDRGATGRDPQYGYGMVDPTGALTAELPTVLRNPLDTTASPGIARFGNAPISGQAQSAPDSAAAGTVGTRLPGLNAGTAARAGDPAATGSNHGWWAAGLLFLLSVVAAIFTVRRFATIA